MASERDRNLAAYMGIVNSPEWQNYLSSGRATNAPQDYTKKSAVWAVKYANEELARLRNEDKSISNYYELATGQKATPEIISKYSQYASDPALLQAAIGKGAAVAPAQGQFRDTIAATVQDKLGRPPTESELGYFGKQMESGNLDPYGLGEFLTGTTEYQTKASDVARTKLASELGAVDDTYLAKTQKALEAKYAAAGRGGSSAFGSSLIQAGKDLATERTGYLAGLGYQDFQQGRGNLTAAYNNRLNQMYNQQQSNAALGAESRQRYYSNQDFQRQQAAQERLARLSNRGSGNFLQSLAPGLIQGGLTIGGALIGGPVGAAAGSSLGSAYNRSSRLNTGGYYGGY